MTNKNYIKSVEEEFEKKFVRQDGLMNKYDFLKNGDEDTMAECIKEFFLSKLQESYLAGKEEIRKKHNDMIKLRLKYCQGQNGMPVCKNCGLDEGDLIR